MRDVEDSSVYGNACSRIDATGDGFGVGGGPGFGTVCVRADKTIHTWNWIGEGALRTRSISPLHVHRVGAGLGSGLECHPTVDQRAGALAILVRAEQRGSAGR